VLSKGRKEVVSPAVTACDGGNGGERGGIAEDGEGGGGGRAGGVEGDGEGRQGPAPFVLIAAMCAKPRMRRRRRRGVQALLLLLLLLLLLVVLVVVVLVLLQTILMMLMTGGGPCAAEGRPSCHCCARPWLQETAHPRRGGGVARGGTRGRLCVGIVRSV